MWEKLEIVVAYSLWHILNLQWKWSNLVLAFIQIVGITTVVHPSLVLNTVWVSKCSFHCQSWMLNLARRLATHSEPSLFPPTPTNRWLSNCNTVAISVLVSHVCKSVRVLTSIWITWEQDETCKWDMSGQESLPHLTTFLLSVGPKYQQISTSVSHVRPVFDPQF